MFEEKCFLPLDSVAGGWALHLFHIVPMGNFSEKERENSCWKSKRKHTASLAVFILEVMINVVKEVNIRGDHFQWRKRNVK